MSPHGFVIVREDTRALSELAAGWVTRLEMVAMELVAQTSRAGGHVIDRCCSCTDQGCDWKKLSFLQNLKLDECHDDRKVVVAFESPLHLVLRHIS